MPDALKDWIAKNIHKGYSIAQLRDFIAQHGYTKEQFDSAYNSMAPISAKPSGIRQRNPIAIVILSLVSLGIYAFYWFYTTSLEVKESTGILPRRRLLWGFLAMVPFILFFWAFINTASRISILPATNAVGYGSMLLLFSAVLAYTFLGIFSYSYATAVKPLLSGSVGVHFVYLMLFFPGLIIMVNVQKKLNEHS